MQPKRKKRLHKRDIVIWKKEIKKNINEQSCILKSIVPLD